MRLVNKLLFRKHIRKYVAGNLIPGYVLIVKNIQGERKSWQKRNL